MDTGRSARLIELWGRRGSFRTEAEWAELYGLVGEVLQRCHPAILEALAEERDIYISDFFMVKVFETAGQCATPLASPGALCSFFKRYLIDRWRRVQSGIQREVTLIDDLPVALDFEHLLVQADEMIYDAACDLLDYKLSLAACRT